MTAASLQRDGHRAPPGIDARRPVGLTFAVRVDGVRRPSSPHCGVFGFAIAIMVGAVHCGFLATTRSAIADEAACWEVWRRPPQSPPPFPVGARLERAGANKLEPP